MKLKASLIIDFDSTLVKEETLELVAETALRFNRRKKRIQEKIRLITEQGMRGMITFSESLDKRLKLFSATNQNIEEVKGEMANQISESFLQNKNFFQKNAGKIYVVSGGFKECVLPVAEKLAIPPENVFANNFVYNASGGISGVDTDNYLAQEKGKIKQVEAINIANPRCVIGDGYTDFQIKEEGAADHFIAYTEHKRRDEVCGKADEEAKSFDEVLKALEEFGLVK